MEPCHACGRDGDLLQVTSAIDGQSFDVCVTCFEHQAEPVAVVVRAVGQVGWTAIPRQIRQAVRVYDLGDYVTVRTWAERMSKRQLVLRQPDPIDLEESGEADRILRKMRDVQEHAYQPEPRRRRRRFWSLMVFFGFFRDVPA